MELKSIHLKERVVWGMHSTYSSSPAHKYLENGGELDLQPQGEGVEKSWGGMFA
jgi:hypothetical protein